MFKRTIAIICLLFCLFGLVACDEEPEEPKKAQHDSTKWFTIEELDEVGLKGLQAPVDLVGDISTSDFWFNDGYSFHQKCESEEVFTKNAEIYFNYFKTNYDGLFGKTRMEQFSINESEYWYVIEQKDNLEDYFDDNPSKLYKFYYVVNPTLEDGYLKDGAVFTLEIRYEFSTNDDCYLFKLFIEKVNKSHNGVFTYYYKMK